MKNIMKIQHLLLLLTIVLSLSSCVKSAESDAEKRQQEEQQIVNYMKAHGYNSVQPSASGLYYISEVEGTGDTPQDTSDFVIIKYKGWTLDGKLFDSTDTTDVLDNTVSVIPLFALGGPLKFSMGVHFTGWIEALKQMKAGGKAIVIMPSKLSLTYNDYIPKKYEIELVEVIHNGSAYERQKINTYLAANGKALSDSTSSGIYYIETLKGTGAMPSSGKIIYLQYTAMLLDGRIFQQYTTSSVYYTYGSGGNPSGLFEAVNLMQKGGTATVVIPYYRGYGSGYVTNYYGQIVIPWASTLLYTIKLVDIQ